MRTLLDVITEEADSRLDSGSLSNEIERESVGYISASDYIKWVQRSLNRLSGSRIPTNGEVSPAYRAAVREFNRQHTDRDYDDVDEQTQNQLIYANQNSTSYMAWVVRALSVNRLALRSLPSVPISTALVQNAIKAFQSTVGLNVDGFVGAKTELALIKASGSLPPGEQVEPSKSQCGRGSDPASAWPRCNPLLAGLAQIRRDTSKSYRRWVAAAWESVKRFIPQNQIALKSGTSYHDTERIVGALARNQGLSGWARVEARLLIPHGGGVAATAPTLPPGLSSKPIAGGGHYLRITDSNLKSLNAYAKQAYGPFDADKGARAIDNHPYNRRYWVTGPVRSDAARIDLGRRFEGDLVKLHDVPSFKSPAPRGSSRPVLFLPFKTELDRFSS